MLEIGPIFRAMKQNKVAVFLLVIEVAFTLMVGLNCLDILQDNRKRIGRDHGMDEKNIITVTLEPFGDRFQDMAYTQQVSEADLEAIRALPGVIDASAISVLPMIGGGQASMFMPGDNPDHEVRGPFYMGDHHIVDTLGLEIVHGRNLTAEDVLTYDPNASVNALVTQDMAKSLYPDEDALGKTLTTGGELHTIVGIIGNMTVPYAQNNPMESRVVIWPVQPFLGDDTHYVIRVEPGKKDSLVPQIEALLISKHDERLVVVQTMQELKARGYAFNNFMGGMLTTIIVLLVFVTAIGILGMTSFAVSRRKKIIGIRRALGASRLAIVRHFLVENGLIMALGILLGLGGAYLLNLILLNAANLSRLDLPLVMMGTLFLFFIGLISAAMPAINGASVAPAEATRGS